MFSSLIQNAQSTEGALISALGKASAPVAVLTPLMWSGCRWESTTMSMVLGSMPAAPMLDCSRPKVGPVPGGKPVSISTSLEPVLMTTGLNGTLTMPFGM